MNSDSSQEARDALGELSNKLCISNSYKLHSCHRLFFLQVLSSDKKNNTLGCHVFLYFTAYNCT